VFSPKTLNESHSLSHKARTKTLELIHEAKLSHEKIGTDSISLIQFLIGWITSCLIIVDEFTTSLCSGDVSPFHVG
jgi:hypothetical protein